MGAAGDAWVEECAETLVRHGLTNYREVMEYYREDEKLKRLKNDFPRKRQLEWVRARTQSCLARLWLVALAFASNIFGLGVIELRML